MSTQTLASATTDIITAYGNTAKNVVNVYRVGNERAVEMIDQRWASAVEKVGARLAPTVRNGAVTVERKVVGVYARGVALSTNGADHAINRLLEVAERSIEQVASNANRLELWSGIPLDTVASAVVPAVQFAGKIAATMETGSGALVNRVAGAKAPVKEATVKKPAARKTAARGKKPAARKAPAAAAAAEPVATPVDTAAAAA